MAVSPDIVIAFTAQLVEEANQLLKNRPIKGLRLTMGGCYRTLGKETVNLCLNHSEVVIDSIVISETACHNCDISINSGWVGIFTNQGMKKFALGNSTTIDEMARLTIDHFEISAADYFAGSLGLDAYARTACRNIIKVAADAVKASWYRRISLSMNADAAAQRNEVVISFGNGQAIVLALSTPIRGHVWPSIMVLYNRKSGSDQIANISLMDTDIVNRVTLRNPELDWLFETLTETIVRPQQRGVKKTRTGTG